MFEINLFYRSPVTNTSSEISTDLKDETLHAKAHYIIMQALIIFIFPDIPM